MTKDFILVADLLRRFGLNEHALSYEEGFFLIPSTGRIFKTGNEGGLIQIFNYSIDF